MESYIFAMVVTVCDVLPFFFLAMARHRRESPHPTPVNTLSDTGQVLTEFSCH